MKHIWTITVLGLYSSLCFAQELPLRNIQVSGWGFFRHETKVNADYRTSKKDKTDFNQTRITLNLKGDLAENYGYVVMAPQFSKVSGLNEYVSATNPNQQTSGTLYDPRLDIHEGYIALRPMRNENFTILAGRQEFNYGDQLVLGSVPWHRIGRSFDATRVRLKFSDRFNADIFTAKLQENNSAATNSLATDAEFNGAYLSGNQGKYFANTDFYFLKKARTTSGAFSNTSVYGVRVKSQVGESPFDYRMEGSLEDVELKDSSDKKSAYQYDVEFGHTLSIYKTRLAIEYLHASKNYDQLFPTVHKYLGFADQFSRRNVKGVVAHFLTSPVEKITFFADYHILQRSSVNTPAFDFTGNSLGQTGKSKNLANEMDLVIAYDFTKSVQASGGYCWTNPGKYIRDQSPKNNAQNQWSYLQLLVHY